MAPRKTPDTVRVLDSQDPVSVYVHALQASVVLSAGVAFNADHPVVAQAPWAFGLDEAKPVEQATAAPGEKRTVRKS